MNEEQAEAGIQAVDDLVDSNVQNTRIIIVAVAQGITKSQTKVLFRNPESSTRIERTVGIVIKRTYLICYTAA